MTGLLGEGRRTALMFPFRASPSRSSPLPRADEFQPFGLSPPVCLESSTWLEVRRTGSIFSFAFAGFFLSSRTRESLARLRVPVAARLERHWAFGQTL